MAGLAKQHSTATSPNSSEDVESHQATPATKLSAFSPDDTRDFTTSGSRIVRIPAYDLKITTAKSNLSAKKASSSTVSNHDPFVSASPLASSTTKSSIESSKLSPVAAAFTPTTIFDSPLAGDQNYGSYTSTAAPKSSSAGYLLEKNGAANQTLLPGRAISSPGARPTPTAAEQYSSEERTSRSLMIQTESQMSSEEIKGYLNTKSYPSLIAVLWSDLMNYGTIYAKFADIRDADRLYSNIQHREMPWTIKHIAPRYFAMKHHPESLSLAPVSTYEGQVHVVASHSGMAQQLDVGKLSSLARVALEQYGELLTFSFDGAEACKIMFRAEYYNIYSADKALAYLEGVKLAMCTLSITHYEADVGGEHQPLTRSPGPIIIGQEDSALDKAFSNMSVNGYRQPNGFQYARNSSSYQTNLSARPLGDRKEASVLHTPPAFGSIAAGYGTAAVSLSSPTWSPNSDSYNGYGTSSALWSPYSPGTIGQERGSAIFPSQRRTLQHQQPRVHVRFSGRHQHEFSAVHHNVVDVDRIQAGLDVRTTIMLRNIPNKVDQKMLKEIVDESSLGKYDFMYLRIDFANNCNVGYAFINFEDPIWIIDFVNARAGQRWNRFNSDKVAEVSYATIQGRDCLVQKFRNSSVMFEDTKFRPKLFTTGTGPSAGMEEKFPEADNQSKMRRSVENAGHIGLFAPRAGQTYRDEQRRRRSQYDRGTRLAEIEDSYESGHHDYRNQSQSFRSPRPLGTFSGQYPAGFGSYCF